MRQEAKFNNGLGKLSLVKLFVLGASFIISLIAIVFSSSILAKGASLSPDLNINVGSAVSLALTNCDGSNSSVLKLAIDPTPTGTFKSACQTTSVGTNTPGYSLTVRASSTNANYNNGDPTNNLLYLNPIDINNFTNGLPTIDSTTNTLANPSTLDSNTWGFAVEGIDNFDTTYTANDENNNYANLPTTDTTVYNTSEWPITQTDHTFYYATKVDTDTTAGTYGTTITYTAIGENIPAAPKTCKNQANECIMFTVDTTADGTYSIPTSGRVANMNHAYNWDVYVDGYLTDACPGGNCTGTGSTASVGIELTNLSNNQHQILIVSHDEPTPGWGNAFGHMLYPYFIYTGADVSYNKQKLISLDAPFTTMAFAPKVEESTTNASYMFAYVFTGCTNLTTTISILDTYKLPDSITNLSSFLYATHYSKAGIQSPVDLSPIKDWLQQNTSITNLSDFLYHLHSENANLTSPIDLSPIANWFNGNASITNLSGFLSYIHLGNTNLTSPVDLSPIANWFNGNSSITNLSYFLGASHTANRQLTSPINLSPIVNWFNGNSSIRNLSYFLSHDRYDYEGGWVGGDFGIHSGNNNLTSPVDLSPIANWFNGNSSITHLSNFLSSVHSDNNNNLTSPIDLSPIANWFSGNNSIITLSSFLLGTHNNNNNLTYPINLSPIANWFNGNSSINNLSGFLHFTHNRNYVLQSIIDLTPLSSWFNANRAMFTIDSFMKQTHSDNSNLILTGQIILPSWIKTMVNGSGTPLYNTGTGSSTNYSFYQTFHTVSTKAGNTDEVRVQDPIDPSGSVPLSSLGEPSTNRQTYTNRSGIIPVNDNWQ